MTTAPSLSIASPESGETFLFRTSSRGPSGRFAFQWILARGKVGPGEHVHPHETETFHLVSGRLVIVLEGVRHELRPGDTLAVPPGARHRFEHPGDEDAVVEVWTDGPRLEDQFVPLARRYGAYGRLGLSSLPTAIVHLQHAMASGSTVPTSRVFVGAIAVVAAFCRAVLGVRPLDPDLTWTP